MPGALLLLIAVWGWDGSTRPRRRWVAATWVAIGALVFVLLFAKFTAALSMAALTLVVLISTRRPLPRWAAVASAMLGASITSARSGSSAPRRTLPADAVVVLDQFSAQAERGYASSGLVATYLDSVVRAGTVLVPLGVALAIALFLTRRASQHPDRPSKPAIWVAYAAAIACGAWLVAQPFRISRGPMYQHLGVTNVLYLIIALLCLGALLLGSTRPWTSRGAKRAVWVGAFAVASSPFAAAVGTNNPIIGATIFGGTLWAIAAAVGLALILPPSGRGGAHRLAIHALLVTAILAASSLAVFKDTRTPYRTAPYLSQDVPVDSRSFAGLRVTPDEADLIDWLDDQRVALQADDAPALSIATPGALFAFNASGWSDPWFGEAWAISTRRPAVTRPAAHLTGSSCCRRPSIPPAPTAGTSLPTP